MTQRIAALKGDKTLKEFGNSLGVTAQAVSSWVSGRSRPGPKTQQLLKSKYNVDLNWLLTGNGDEPSNDHELHVASTPAIQRVETSLGARDLPIYAAAEGGDGDLVVSTEVIELVPRPWYLKEVKDGFGVIITGESMVPAYEPGDMAIVNPRLPYMRGKIHIFTAESENSHFKATIKRLVSVTETDWVVEQFNPQKTFNLPKSIWTHAKRVVGKYND